MATRNSNDYKIMIIPEVTDGVQIFAGTTGKLLCDTMEWMHEPIVTDRAIKNNKLFDEAKRSVITGKKVTASINGELTTNHEIMLQALFDDATSPYTFAAQMPTAKTYNIYQMYYNASGAVTHYDVLLGAVIPEMTFSGSSTGLWTYTANIEAKTFRENIENDSGNLLSAIPTVTGDPFIFGNTTCSVNFGNSNNVNSVDLTLTKTMDSDENRWQNGFTRNNNRYIGVGGTLSYSYLWDDDGAEMNGQYDKNSDNSYVETITLVAGAKNWQFECTGRMTDITRPDADRGTFIGTVTETLIDDQVLNFTPPITITVT